MMSKLGRTLDLGATDCGLDQPDRDRLGRGAVQDVGELGLQPQFGTIPAQFRDSTAAGSAPITTKCRAFSIFSPIFFPRWCTTLAAARGATRRK